MSKPTKRLFKALWQVILRALLVPVYKFFLFFNKYTRKHLIHNPYLTAQQIKMLSRQNTPAHIIIIIIALFAIIINLSTRETYAEQFNRKSIVAQLLISNGEEEFVEKSPDFRQLAEQPKTESIHNQLSMLEAKQFMYNQQNSEIDNLAKKQISLSQGGEALIKPTESPFEEEKSPTQNKTPSNDKKIKAYTVQGGDTISGIAKKFGISINTILWENNLSLSSYIRPGEKLTILPTSGVTHRVRSGDTLGAIAKKYGTSLNKILAFNDIESNAKIKVNQKLVIPDGKLGYGSPVRTRSIYSSTSKTISTKKFIWPTSSKRITQYYHWRHHAVDIANKIGSPIYASMAGRIERAGWSRGYGYNVVINHGGGIKTLYAHSSKLYVQRGQQVKQGEIISAIGSTGWSTGPHLHFEIIINGKKVNPLSYL